MSGGTLYTSAKRPRGQILAGTLCTTTPDVIPGVVLQLKRFFAIRSLKRPSDSTCAGVVQILLGLGRDYYYNLCIYI